MCRRWSRRRRRSSRERFPDLCGAETNGRGVTMGKVRVMVVDDSALMRKLISGVLMKDPELEVVNTAMDGLFALKKIPQARPDVITLDLEMPRMDGLTALRYIVNDYHIPVVLVSSFTTQGGHLTLDGRALHVGLDRRCADAGQLMRVANFFFRLHAAMTLGRGLATCSLSTLPEGST